jgi:hypothetical protein
MLSGTAMLAPGLEHATTLLAATTNPAAHCTWHVPSTISCAPHAPETWLAPRVTLHGLGTHVPTDWTEVSLAVAHVTFWLPDTV